jgi:hypothetical protein
MKSRERKTSLTVIGNARLSSLPLSCFSSPYSSFDDHDRDADQKERVLRIFSYGYILSRNPYISTSYLLENLLPGVVGNQ